MVMETKIYPHNVDSEETLIGSVLVDSNVMSKIVNILQTNDFYSARNGFIFQAFKNLYERREKINQITVAQELNRQEKLESIGGAPYLLSCESVCVDPRDAESCANIIVRLSLSRKLIDTGMKLSDLGQKALPTHEEIFNQSSDIFNEFLKTNIITGSDIVTPMDSANVLMEMFEEYGEEKHSMSYGFFDLDKITTGINTEFIVVGARPSVGKSQFMLDIAEKLNEQGVKVFFVTSEMGIKQVMERKISRELGIPIVELRKSGIPQEKEHLYFDMVGNITDGNIYYKTGKIYARDVYRHAQNLKEKFGLGIIFVDYLQFLADCWEDSKENQNIRVGKACKILKNIVTELSIPVVLASQLNRSIEYRSKDLKQPVLADLRDSGNIEQDADVVLLLHRNEIDDYNLDSVLQIKMAKHRQLGVAPTISLAWNKNSHRYVDYTNREE
jgi:replicative DNA helicase